LDAHDHADLDAHDHADLDALAHPHAPTVADPRAHSTWTSQTLSTSASPATSTPAHSGASASAPTPGTTPTKGHVSAVTNVGRTRAGLISVCGGFDEALAPRRGPTLSAPSRYRYPPASTCPRRPYDPGKEVPQGAADRPDAPVLMLRCF